MIRIRGTVFENLKDVADDEDEIDRDSLKGLFSQDPKREPERGRDPAKPSGRTAGKGKNAFVTLLDLKRGSNIEIMLSQIKASLDDIAAAVQTIDDEVLDAESVQSMIRFLPTADELALVRSYEGDEQRLGKAERYFRRLGTVNGFESKLRARFQAGVHRDGGAQLVRHDRVVLARAGRRRWAASARFST